MNQDIPTFKIFGDSLDREVAEDSREYYLEQLLIAREALLRDRPDLAAIHLSQSLKVEQGQKKGEKSPYGKK